MSRHCVSLSVSLSHEQWQWGLAQMSMPLTLKSERARGERGSNCESYINHKQFVFGRNKKRKEIHCNGHKHAECSGTISEPGITAKGEEDTASNH